MNTNAIGEIGKLEGSDLPPDYTPEQLQAFGEELARQIEAGEADSPFLRQIEADPFDTLPPPDAAPSLSPDALVIAASTTFAEDVKAFACAALASGKYDAEGAFNEGLKLAFKLGDYRPESSFRVQGNVT